jgi:hypothetical protein
MADSPSSPQVPGQIPRQDSVLTESWLASTRSHQVLGDTTSVSAAYRILLTNQFDPYDQPRSPMDLLSPELAAPPGMGENYQGTARKAAKLSIANAPLETFAEVSDLIRTLPSISTMVNHHPPITTQADSNRVNEENRNVRVRAFLYAASREADNDFHLIIGRDPQHTPNQCITVEVSGLPPQKAPSYPALKAVRDSFQQFFGPKLPVLSYSFYQPPIPVEVEGSLFFDMSHSRGAHPGPPDLQSVLPTIWEIHPITHLTFEP